MRCNPWRWLWGLIPVVMLSWITFHLEQNNIESDLKARSTEALDRAGLGWAASSFSGRDGLLTGKAADEAEPKSAADLVRKVWGVRVVDSRTDLIEKLDTYLWSAAREGKLVKLTGFVPGEQTRRAVLNAAKSRFPGARIEDGMQLARGAPQRDVFLAGVGFGLKQLAALKAGRVELAGTDFSIAGQAPDVAAFRAVRSEVTNKLPKGIKLVAEKITGPVIDDYLWRAVLGPKLVVLSGYVPNEAVREKLFGEAKRLFPRSAVVDRQEVGNGAPDGFETAAGLGLEQLYQLQEGTATIDGRRFSLVGRAEDEPTAEAARQAIRTRAPASLTSTSDITAPSSPAPTAAPTPLPQASGPYEALAELNGGVLILKGVVPDDATRVAIVVAVRGKMPDRTVKDELQIRAGAPNGWQACWLAGLSGLPRLSAGEVRISDLSVALAGQTDDDTVAAAVPGEVRQAASQNCATTANVRSTGRVQADARRKAEEADAKRKADEEARRLAEDERKRTARQAEANRCQTLLTSAASEGVILFQRANADLDNKSRPTLDQVAKIANQCPGFKISIEGHTDSEGIPERNRPLSERRAKAVADYLAAAGVDAARLSSVGFGADDPVADNESAEGRAKNRRIEFEVVAD